MMSKIKSNYVGGTWVNGAKVVSNINPSDLSDVIGEYSQGDVVQTESAIAAAREAFTKWAYSTPQDRFDLLDRIGTALLSRREELGRLLSREEGKVLAEGIGEVTRAGQIFKYFAGESLRLAGEVLPSVRAGISIEVTREPLGVIGLITPWNFPMAIPAWKVAPALAYGNCVVLKPAELVPGSAHALGEIIAEAGAPAGLFNLMMGSGSVVGETLVTSPQVDAISFTGSVATGRVIAAKALSSGKKIQLEMGGKNPLVVLDDADLGVAVDAALNGAFFSTGQRCTASSRLIVTGGIHNRFVAALQERLAHLVVDDALKAGTHIGPVVDQTQLDQDLNYLSIGQEEGAYLAFGGRRLKREREGFYLQPALFTEANNAMHICREEIFGPVAAVIRVKDYEEALAIANDTPFGLCSGICTTSLKFATHFKRNSAAGMVMVNLPTAGVDYHVPFGGRKGSSYGPREQGRYAVEFFTTVKTAYTAA
jgi:aldehyde dehydrogenase (NAD+)